MAEEKNDLMQELSEDELNAVAGGAMAVALGAIVDNVDEAKKVGLADGVGPLTLDKAKGQPSFAMADE